MRSDPRSLLGRQGPPGRRRRPCDAFACQPTCARRRRIAAVLVVVGSFGFWLRTSSLVRVKQVTVTGIDGRQARAIRDALTSPRST